MPDHVVVQVVTRRWWLTRELAQRRVWHDLLRIARLNTKPVACCKTQEPSSTTTRCLCTQCATQLNADRTKDFVSDDGFPARDDPAVVSAVTDTVLNSKFVTLSTASKSRPELLLTNPTQPRVTDRQWETMPGVWKLREGFADAETTTDTLKSKGWIVSGEYVREHQLSNQVLDDVGMYCSAWEGCHSAGDRAVIDAATGLCSRVYNSGTTWARIRANAVDAIPEGFSRAQFLELRDRHAVRNVLPPKLAYLHYADVSLSYAIDARYEHSCAMEQRRRQGSTDKAEDDAAELERLTNAIDRESAKLQAAVLTAKTIVLVSCLERIVVEQSLRVVLFPQYPASCYARLLFRLKSGRLTHSAAEDEAIVPSPLTVAEAAAIVQTVGARKLCNPRLVYRRLRMTYFLYRVLPASLFAVATLPLTSWSPFQRAVDEAGARTIAQAAQWALSGGQSPYDDAGFWPTDVSQAPRRPGFGGAKSLPQPQQQQDDTTTAEPLAMFEPRATTSVLVAVVPKHFEWRRRFRTVLYLIAGPFAVFTLAATNIMRVRTARWLRRGDVGSATMESLHERTHRFLWTDLRRPFGCFHLLAWYRIAGWVNLILGVTMTFFWLSLVSPQPRSAVKVPSKMQESPDHLLSEILSLVEEKDALVKRWGKAKYNWRDCRDPASNNGSAELADRLADGVAVHQQPSDYLVVRIWHILQGLHYYRDHPEKLDDLAVRSSVLDVWPWKEELRSNVQNLRSFHRRLINSSSSSSSSSDACVDGIDVLTVLAELVSDVSLFHGCFIAALDAGDIVDFCTAKRKDPSHRSPAAAALPPPSSAKTAGEAAVFGNPKAGPAATEREMAETLLLRACDWAAPEGCQGATVHHESWFKPYIYHPQTGANDQALRPVTNPEVIKLFTTVYGTQQLRAALDALTGNKKQEEVEKSVAAAKAAAGPAATQTSGRYLEAALQCCEAAYQTPFLSRQGDPLPAKENQHDQAVLKSARRLFDVFGAGYDEDGDGADDPVRIVSPKVRPVDISCADGASWLRQYSVWLNCFYERIVEGNARADGTAQEPNVVICEGAGLAQENLDWRHLTFRTTAANSEGRRGPYYLSDECAMHLDGSTATLDEATSGHGAFFGFYQLYRQYVAWREGVPFPPPPVDADEAAARRPRYIRDHYGSPRAVIIAGRPTERDVALLGSAENDNLSDRTSVPVLIAFVGTYYPPVGRDGGGLSFFQQWLGANGCSAPVLINPLMKKLDAAMSPTVRTGSSKCRDDANAAFGRYDMGMPADACAHAGYLNMWSHMAPSIEATLAAIVDEEEAKLRAEGCARLRRSNRVQLDVHVVGHSLGGGVAQLCAAYLSAPFNCDRGSACTAGGRHSRVVNLHTAGAPPVFNPAALRELNSRRNLIHRRFARSLDVVTFISDARKRIPIFRRGHHFGHPIPLTIPIDIAEAQELIIGGAGGHSSFKYAMSITQDIVPVHHDGLTKTKAQCIVVEESSSLMWAAADKAARAAIYVGSVPWLAFFVGFTGVNDVTTMIGRRVGRLIGLRRDDDSDIDSDSDAEVEDAVAA